MLEKELPGYREYEKKVRYRLIPVVLMIMNKDKISTLGFYKENAVRQIFVGIIIAAAMSVVLTLIPHLAGFGEYVDNGKRYKYLWQYIFDLFYCIVSVAGAEEFVFRGYLYQKLKEISGNDLTAILCSSAAFGLFHILSGNICQMVVTGCIGVLFCICRRKIRNCSTLSLIIAHGLYDFMITVWSSVL